MKATFGPSGNPEEFYASGGKRTVQIFPWLKQYGLDAYEYSAGKGIHGSVETFAEMGKAARENGILTSFHTPYFISLSGTDPEKRLKSIGYIKQSLEAARALCADTIVIHSGSAAKISREDALALSKDTMSRAVGEIPDDGIRLGIETMGKVNQLGTLDEVIEICKISDRLCPVVDFGHLNARDFGGVFKTADDYKRVFDKIGEALGDEKAKNLHCHFSKIEYTVPGGEKQHLTFDDAVFGPEFEPLGEVIVKYGLSPRIICESAGTQARDALYMKRCTYAEQN